MRPGDCNDPGLSLRGTRAARRYGAAIPFQKRPAPDDGTKESASKRQRAAEIGGKQKKTGGKRQETFPKTADPAEGEKGHWLMPHPYKLRISLRMGVIVSFCILKTGISGSFVYCID